MPEGRETSESSVLDETDEKLERMAQFHREQQRLDQERAQEEEAKADLERVSSGIPAQEPATALAKASSSTSAAPAQTRERKRKTAVSPPASVRARKDSQASPGAQH